MRKLSQFYRTPNIVAFHWAPEKVKWAKFSAACKNRESKWNQNRLNSLKLLLNNKLKSNIFQLKYFFASLDIEFLFLFSSHESTFHSSMIHSIESIQNRTEWNRNEGEKWNWFGKFVSINLPFLFSFSIPYAIAFRLISLLFTSVRFDCFRFHSFQRYIRIEFSTGKKTWANSMKFSISLHVLLLLILLLTWKRNENRALWNRARFLLLVFNSSIIFGWSFIVFDARIPRLLLFVPTKFKLCTHMCVQNEYSCCFIDEVIC